MPGGDVSPPPRRRRARGARPRPWRRPHPRAWARRPSRRRAGSRAARGGRDEVLAARRRRGLGEGDTRRRLPALAGAAAARGAAGVTTAGTVAAGVGATEGGRAGAGRRNCKARGMPRGPAAWRDARARRLPRRRRGSSSSRSSASIAPASGCFASEGLLRLTPPRGRGGVLGEHVGQPLAVLLVRLLLLRLGVALLVAALLALLAIRRVILVVGRAGLRRGPVVLLAEVDVPVAKSGGEGRDVGAIVGQGRHTSKTRFQTARTAAVGNGRAGDWEVESGSGGTYSSPLRRRRNRRTSGGARWRTWHSSSVIYGASRRRGRGGSGRMSARGLFWHPACWHHRGLEAARWRRVRGARDRPVGLDGCDLGSATRSRARANAFAASGRRIGSRGCVPRCTHRCPPGLRPYRGASCPSREAIWRGSRQPQPCPPCWLRGARVGP